MRYHLLSELMDAAKKADMPLWEIVCREDALERQVSEEDSFKTMRQMYQSMREADENYDAALRSASGMVGGDGEKMHQYNKEHQEICSEYMGLVMEKALKMGESNACMKRIVAAPTAGSCGVLPAVFLSYQSCFAVPEETMVQALFVSAGIGMIIAENASISGASGGCQAEIGTAAAMAAGGLVYLSGGSDEMIASAVAVCLKSMLGLVCDPVCGLVEVPCIKRNVSGCMNAVSAAQMALAGIQSVIPADEVIDAMRRVGNQLPACLKETAKGGLATTHTASVIENHLLEEAKRDHS